MAVKAIDARAQQVLDSQQPTGKLALRLLTAAQTHHVVAAGNPVVIIRSAFTLDKSIPE